MSRTKKPTFGCFWIWLRVFEEKTSTADKAKHFDVDYTCLFFSSLTTKLEHIAQLRSSANAGRTSRLLVAKFSHHVHRISPGKPKCAIHISSFVGNILVKFGKSSGSRQIEGQPLVDRLRAGGVLNYTQHSGLLGRILYLRIRKNGRDIRVIYWIYFFMLVAVKS